MKPNEKGSFAWLRCVRVHTFSVATGLIACCTMLPSASTSRPSASSSSTGPRDARWCAMADAGGASVCPRLAEICAAFAAAAACRALCAATQHKPQALRQLHWALLFRHTTWNAWNACHLHAVRMIVKSCHLNTPPSTNQNLGGKTSFENVSTSLHPKWRHLGHSNRNNLALFTAPLNKKADKTCELAVPQWLDVVIGLPAPPGALPAAADAGPFVSDSCLFSCVGNNSNVISTRLAPPEPGLNEQKLANSGVLQRHITYATIQLTTQHHSTGHHISVSGWA